MECNACQLEMNSLLCDMPSQWRSQIANVICNHLVNKGVSCLEITSCLEAEMSTLDPLCLVETQLEWESLTYLGKMQKIIDKLCSLLDVASFYVENTFSISLTGNGQVDTPLSANIILDPNPDNPLSIGANGLMADLPYTYDNGLTLTDTNVQLGGPLIEDTNLTLNANYLRFNGINGSGVVTADNEFWVYQSGALAGSPTTYMYQLPNYTKIATSTVAERATESYIAKSFLKVDAVNEYALLASYYPNSDNDAILPPSAVIGQSTIKARPFGADIEANRVYLNSPYATQLSGLLPIGGKYKILTNSGGADFTLAGAPDNLIGTTFYADGGVPAWGTGSLEMMGAVLLQAPYAGLAVESGSCTMSINSPLAAPYDFELVRIANPTYYEMQLYKATEKALVSYITEGTLYVKHDSAGLRRAVIGVSTPTSDELLTPAPAETEYTCFSEWLNSTTGETKGQMITHSPFAQFLGIAGVNGGDIKVGVNTGAPSTALDVSTAVTSAPSFRIRQDFTPASSVATGNKGDICWDADYIYVCVAANTWKRTVLTTW